MSQTKFFKLYLFLAVFVTGLWAELDRANFLMVIILAALPIVFEKWSPLATHQINILKIDFLFSKFHFWGCLLLSFPALVLALLNAQGEIPFSGDHSYHIQAAYRVFSFWGNYGWIFVTLILLRQFYKKVDWQYKYVLTIFILYALSHLVKAPEAVARYPGLFYFLTSPLLALQRITEFFPPVLVLGLTNAASIFIYLWWLRPKLFGTKLDWQAALLAVVFFWQSDVVYYSASNYLEPWSLVCVFIALEAVIKNDRRSYLPLLAIGAGSLIKEPTILFLPFVWLAQIKLKPFHRESFVAHVFYGIFAALPFLLYYSVRRDFAIWRTYTPMGLEEMWSAARFQRILNLFPAERMNFDYAIVAMLGLLIVSLLILSRQRHIVALIFSVAALQWLLFFSDRLTLVGQYEGYFRFYMQIFAAISSLIFFLENHKWKKHMPAMVVLVGLFQTVKMSPIFSAAHKEKWALNQFEHTDCPQYYPYKSLIQSAVQQKIITSGDTMLVNSPTTEHRADIMHRMNKDLWANYRWINKDTWQCQCVGQEKIIMPIFIDNRRPHFDHDRAQACLEELQATCPKQTSITTKDGVLWGFLGSK